VTPARASARFPCPRCDPPPFIVRADGGSAHRLTPWTLNAEHPTWSPDSRWVTYNSPQGTIEAIHPGGRGRHTIPPETARFGGHKPWFSPDGARILFTCAITDSAGHENDDICVMRADGSKIVDITNTPARSENWPSWGPAPEHQSQRKP
jgi:Tol biopolymer transport system component